MEYKFIEGSSGQSENPYTIEVDKESELSMDNLFLSMSKIGKISNKKDVKISLDGIKDTKLAELINENLVLSSYSYKKTPGKLELSGKSILAEVVNECRKIIDTPANLMDAENLTNYIISQKVEGLTHQVLGYDQLKSAGLNGIIAINSGSEKPPKMLVIRYGDSTQQPIVLIGKGIIFDSGGLNLKPGEFVDMKADKTGAVYAWGLMKALAINRAKGHYISLLPMAENMPSAKAVHPGDIYNTCDGRTVEITNTDAEGRIILADAMCWMTKNIKNPKLVIDIATLTGMAAAFFGSMGTAAMCNKKGKPFLNQLIQIGDERHEYYWEVPLHRVFRSKLESNVADLQNFTAGINAGTIMAGMFLKEFILETIPWIHLDIAGVSFKTVATGEPMLSLYHYISNL